MITEKELNKIITDIDLQEKITLLAYKGNEVFYDLIKLDNKEIILELKKPELKLEFLPVIFSLCQSESFQSTSVIPNYDKKGERYSWEGLIPLNKNCTEQYDVNIKILLDFLKNQSSQDHEIKDFYEKMIKVQEQLTAIYVEFIKK
ncbi:hypothetical protein A6A19_00300 [Actinobacillus delphinicola]|uniref:hypothetical protein n=1 Tax=Actinobacillus delphinicola TaxID=51161 RepID=UPI00244245DD|nr:hypothetical protein [Actinobacillus delphinicola]MDG6896486.1 hypothetical protein [Actinobacillus delphinicola]